MMEITSSQNPIIKELKQLKQKKSRDVAMNYFIEGGRFVDEAIKFNQHIISIIVSSCLNEEQTQFYLNLSSLKNINFYCISEKLFREVSDTVNPQGIMAIVSYDTHSVGNVLSMSKLQRFIVLDCVQDPGNMGTIIRTADAFGFDGIISLTGCVDVYNPKVLRSTMGSIFRVNIAQDISYEILFDELYKNSIVPFASSLEDAEDISKIIFPEKIALIVGNEANGIRDEIISNCSRKIKIPMIGNTESLNVSIATAVMMYEINRSKL